MNRFAGLRILVVEDEPVVAMCLEDILLDLGCVTVGPASRLGEGLELAGGSTLDAAILDINLGGVSSAPIAELLRQRAIPFAFTSGYGTPPEGFEAQLLIEKPYREATIAEALERLLLPECDARTGP